MPRLRCLLAGSGETLGGDDRGMPAARWQHHQLSSQWRSLTWILETHSSRSAPQSHSRMTAQTSAISLLFRMSSAPRRTASRVRSRRGKTKRGQTSPRDFWSVFGHFVRVEADAAVERVKVDDPAMREAVRCEAAAKAMLSAAEVPGGAPRRGCQYNEASEASLAKNFSNCWRF